MSTPADCSTAIRAEMSKHDSAMKKIANGMGISGGKLGSIDFSLDRIDIGKGGTLAQALAALSDEVRKPVVIVIDEARHALTSQAGMDKRSSSRARR